MTERGTKRGRPVDPAGQVQRLEGDEEAKHRLKLVLETLTGSRTVEEACAELGIGATRFFELKHDALSGALAALSPRPLGRPGSEPDAGVREKELEAKVARLEEDLQCALVRTELAIAMPRLLKRGAKKKERRNTDHVFYREPRRGPRPPLAPPPGTDDDDAGTDR